MVQYNCICCSYKTDRKLNYTRHMSSKLHLKSEKGLETQSEDNKLFEANQIIKKLTEDNANLLNTIKRLNSMLDKNDKIDNKPRSFELINDSFCHDFIRTEKEIQLEQNNELEDIMYLNIENIKKSIPFFNMYLKCLLESNTDALTNYINCKFKPTDYTIDDDGDIYFYNEKEEKVDINTCFRIMRRSIASQIKKSKEFYYELLNKYRKNNVFDIDIDFDVFNDILSTDGKAITLQYFTDCLPIDTSLVI